MWDKKTKKYLVKSTGEDTIIRAREVAQELALSLLKTEKPVEREYTFGHFALKLLHRSRLQHQTGERSQGRIKALQWAVQNEDWGLLRFFVCLAPYIRPLIFVFSNKVSGTGGFMFRA